MNHEDCFGIAELLPTPHWVAWRFEDRDGKRTKVPVNPHTGDRASSTDPRTWGSATLAEACRLEHGYPGVGFVVSGDYVGVDLDGCLEGDTLSPFAAHIVAQLDSYTERTPSKTGLRVWCRGQWTHPRRRTAGVEVYGTGRFFTVTADAFPGTPAVIGDRQRELDVLAAELFADPPPPSPVLRSGFETRNDETLLDKALGARNGEAFAKLWRGDHSAYESQSEADLALASHLLFWTNHDVVRADALFRQSGLMRPKWDTRRGAQTYGDRTWDKARRGEGFFVARNGDEPTRLIPPVRPALTRLSTVTAKRVQWLWPGYIPAGKVTVWDGDPGLGKSVAACDIAARITTGFDMPDRTSGDLDGKRGVVMLSAEDDPEDTIRPRFDLAGGDAACVTLLRATRDEHGERLPTIADLDAIDHAIRDVDAALVIIDPFMAYLPDERDSHKDQDIRRALAPLADLAARTGVAMLIIRHLNKSAGSNPLYRGGGSIGIIGAARAGCLFATDPDDPTGVRRIMAPHKHNLSAKAPALAFRLKILPVAGLGDLPRVEWLGVSETTVQQLLDVPTTAAERSELDEAIEFLNNHLAPGPDWQFRIRSEAGKAGISYRTLTRARYRLHISADKAGFSGRWFWSLPSTPLAVREAFKNQEERA